MPCSVLEVRNAEPVGQPETAAGVVKGHVRIAIAAVRGYDARPGVHGHEPPPHESTGADDVHEHEGPRLVFAEPAHPRRILELRLGDAALHDADEAQAVE